jgi:hypothetical protein
MSQLSRISSALPAIGYAVLPTVVDKLVSLVNDYVCPFSTTLSEVKSVLVLTSMTLIPRHCRIPALFTYVVCQAPRIYSDAKDYLLLTRYSQLLKAVKKKNLSQIQALHQQNANLIFLENIDNSKNIMHFAVKYDALEIIEWVHRLDPQMFYKRDDNSWNALELAAMNGNIPILEWAYTQDPKILHWDEDYYSLIEVAIIHGNIDTANWIYKKNPSSVEKLKDIKKHRLTAEMTQWVQEKSSNTSQLLDQ